MYVIVNYIFDFWLLIMCMYGIIRIYKIKNMWNEMVNLVFLMVFGFFLCNMVFGFKN